MLAHRNRLPLAFVVAALAAGGATLLLRPRSGMVTPASANAGDYFTPEQLQRARDFRGPQPAILLASLVIKSERLPAGSLRAEVLDVARRANVNVGEVYRVDASRRTTATNAYVWGIGRTKRVVMYDTLIRDYPDDQVRSVVAHELSHVV